MTSKFLGIAVLLTSLFIGWLWLDYQNAIKQVLVDKTVYVEIEKGDSLNRIIEKLQDQGLSIKPIWFKCFAYLNEKAALLKTGEYELAENSTVPELIDLFVSGKVRQHSITFPEGWTFSQLYELIRKNDKVHKTIDTMDLVSIASMIDRNYSHPEGLFFPDTYFFEKNTTDIALLKRAYDRMRTVLETEWQNRQPDLPLTSPYQALILASIIEKETGLASERPAIAGVFVRRLKQDMMLQTDPTVIYGMGSDYDGDIRSKDLKTPTPYNTYVIKGLPPTPIALPGREAIRAALHPEPGESLYFVARGDGSHVFSDTLKKHQEAVNLYQLGR
ncbi:MAG: endolytic transglycosylase MltG [Methylomicrobium sp.]|nr:endolytic transglycosylase MltG [Methylomicrobium sp.]